MPSATVRKTAPIADLQYYRTVRVRAGSAPEAASWAAVLASATASKLGQFCKFERVDVGDRGASDLVVDLNIQRVFRGGTGIVQNPNLATMEVLMVLSDGANEDLVGSAWIRGQSPQVMVNASSPEQAALEAVSGKITEVMYESGCFAQRADRPAPPSAAPPVPSGEATPTVEQAEALNNEGKSLFRDARVQEAVAKFEQAFALHQDARYLFNLCFAYETMQRYDQALATCQQVLGMSPDPRLAEKARERIQSIESKRASGG